MCLWWCMHRAVVLISPCKMSGLSYLSVPTWQPCQLQQRPLQGPHASLVLPAELLASRCCLLAEGLSCWPAAAACLRRG